MNTKEILAEITTELDKTFACMDQTQINDLKKEIEIAHKIFVAGAGRSLLMLRGLAMRLMQIGFLAYVVGDTITPAIEKGDLLIIASGSGETGTLKVIAKKCKEFEAKLVLITAMEESTIAKLADYVIKIPAATTKAKNNQINTLQLGASTFEQGVLLLGDALISDLTQRMCIKDENAVLMKRHANLE